MSEPEEQQEPIPFTRHDVQMTEIIVSEMRAKRTPESHLVQEAHHANLKIVGIYAHDGNAQLTYEVQVDEAPDGIYAAFVANFTYDAAKHSEDSVRTFLNGGVSYILLPYVRELVSHLTLRMGLAPIILPLVIVPQGSGMEEHTPIE